LLSFHPPVITFAITSLFVGLLNLGWKKFAIETDPVRLWVAPGSESVVQKEHFDSNFGPFFRPQQIFITSSASTSHSSFSLSNVSSLNDDDQTSSSSFSLPDPSEPVLSYSRLSWWLEHEDHITNSLCSSPNNYTFQDVCFSPAGPGTPCVVQSVSAWFGGWLDEDSWEETVDQCASRPAECLPDFGQPIEPKFVLGGVDKAGKGKKGWRDAKSMVVTFVVNGSQDPEALAKAEEWERALEAYLKKVSITATDEADAWMAFSTGVSLEEELNKSTNTDYKTVVASYLLMFLYVSLTLGGGGTGSGFFFGEDGLFPILGEKAAQLPVMLHLVRAPTPPSSSIRPSSSAASTSSPSRQFNPRISRLLSLLPTIVSVNSKFTLGLFGIAMVLVAVSTSVGLFSLLGVKVTLIIAEVIPFLVLAVGVDNVFILVHELARQNSLHGPGATATAVSHLGGESYTDDLEDEDEQEVVPPSHLSPEERVARALARMGPSILLSSLTETIAFGLGALVPMPAVRNFALYAAGSVALDAILQVTVFVSAMALDLRRVEVRLLLICNLYSLIFQADYDSLLLLRLLEWTASLASDSSLLSVFMIRLHPSIQVSKPFLQPFAKLG
jgi:Niemann-Pick C1 protein